MVNVCAAIRDHRKLRGARLGERQPTAVDAPTDDVGDTKGVEDAGTTINVSEGKSIDKDWSGVARESNAPFSFRARAAHETGDL